MTLKLNGSTSGSSSIDAPASGSDRTITCPDATGTMALTSNLLFSSYAIICDQKDSGVDGGTFTSAAWRTRDLNTEIADPDGIVSISSNQFTLQAGTYLVKATVPAYKATTHVAKLYNATDSSDIQMGTAQTAHISYLGDASSKIYARFTLSGAKALEIQHICSHTVANVGFGSGHSYGVNVYTVVEIYKEA